MENKDLPDFKYKLYDFENEPKGEGYIDEIILFFQQSGLKKLITQMNLSSIKDFALGVELGLDSIVGVEWITSINKIYNLNIKATKVYDYPTLLDLAKHISEIKSSHNGSSLSQGDQITSKESPKNQDLSIDPQEDVRQKVRSILSQVANKKLTAQEANKIIAKIKQGG